MSSAPESTGSRKRSLTDTLSPQDAAPGQQGPPTATSTPDSLRGARRPHSQHDFERPAIHDG